MPQQDASLNEQWVLNQAQDWLARIHYGSCGKGVIEQLTVPANEKRRAFSTVAFFLRNKQPYLALIAAQTAATVDQLEYQNDQERASRIAISLLLWMAFSVVLYFPGQAYEWSWWYLLGALATSAALLVLTFYAFHRFLPTIEQLNLRMFQSIAFVNQFGKMSANEKWLALASDALPPEELAALIFQCRREGVGLLLVPRLGQPRVQCLPRPDDHHFDYLNQYPEASPMLDRLRGRILDSTGRFANTAALKLRQRYQNGTGLLAATIAIAVISLVAIPASGERSSGNRLSAFADSEARQANRSRPSQPMRRLEVEGYDIRYFVADSFWDQPSDAAQRIDRLKMAGIYSSYSVWMPDYINSYIQRGTYCVLFGPPVSSESLAHQMLEDNYYRLSDRNIETYFPRMFKVYLEKGRQDGGQPQFRN